MQLPRPPILALVLALVLALATLLAQPALPLQRPTEGATDPEGSAAPEEPRLRWGFVAKAHFRDSEELSLPSPFPFEPDDLPPGQDQGFMETVNPGSHLELSLLSLHLEYAWSEWLNARAKIDFLRLYDRNPTSDGREIDVDELWIRFGRESPPAVARDGTGAYLKLGKFGKFERQDDRHLESYGLLSTAFNRFEDVGLELGVEVRNLYFRGSYTQGNPLFFRDPNALAGDNGVEELLRGVAPELGTGFPILYDAALEALDVDGDLELGLGLGVRFGSPSSRVSADLLVFGFERQLAETVELEGTFYGGDLDLLLGPMNAFPLPVSDDEKREVGGNLWLYSGGFSFFGQYVDQEVAGMDRTGFEAEVAWSFPLPLRFATGGRQLFTYLQPAVRFSRLEPELAGGSPLFPAPSVRWEWEKLDVGVRLGILSGVDLTAEWNDNTFVVKGEDRTQRELLVTLSWAL